MTFSADDFVAALGLRYSRIREIEGGVYFLQLKDRDATELEIRLESEWIRLFAWLDAVSADEQQLRGLLRSNEGFLFVRYAVEDDRFVLRADLPIRLWAETEMHATLDEMEQALDRDKARP